MRGAAVVFIVARFTKSVSGAERYRATTAKSGSLSSGANMAGNDGASSGNPRASLALCVVYSNLTGAIELEAIGPGMPGWQSLTRDRASFELRPLVRERASLQPFIPHHASRVRTSQSHPRFVVYLSSPSARFRTLSIQSCRTKQESSAPSRS